MFKRLILLIILMASTFLAVQDTKAAYDPGCSFNAPTLTLSGSWWTARAGTSNCSVAKVRQVQVCLYNAGFATKCLATYRDLRLNHVIAYSCQIRSGLPFGHMQAWGWVQWSDGTTTSKWGTAVYRRDRC